MAGARISLLSTAVTGSHVKGSHLCTHNLLRRPMQLCKAMSSIVLLHFTMVRQVYPKAPLSSNVACCRACMKRPDCSPTYDRACSGLKLTLRNFARCQEWNNTAGLLVVPHHARKEPTSFRRLFRYIVLVRFDLEQTQPRNAMHMCICSLPRYGFFMTCCVTSLGFSTAASLESENQEADQACRLRANSGMLVTARCASLIQSAATAACRLIDRAYVQ